MKGEKIFTFSTKKGSQRLLVLFIALIVLSSLFARFIQTDFGRIKVEQIALDARGASLTAELYYPAGTTSKDLYPGIVITHGGGCTYMTSRIWAEELARRDFVVLNVSAYGAGLSEQPAYDENDQGVESFNGDLTPMGLIDAKNFLSGLAFVDSERIGMAGHSMGSRRTSFAAVMDCGFLTLNDRLINILYEKFGVQLTEAELYTSADILAEQYLTADQLSHYQDLAQIETNVYNNELHSICIIGGIGSTANILETVTVAGYEVQRNCQVNMCFLNGTMDTNNDDLFKLDATKQSWYTNGEEAELETWYALDDETQTSTTLGKIYDISVSSDSALDQAISDRSARIVIHNKETHSKNFYSSATTSDLVKFFEQSLKYNRGELADSSTAPLDASDNIWQLRSVGNIIAMFSMFGMLIALASLLFKSELCASCVCTVSDKAHPVPLNKAIFWAFGAVTVILSFIVVYRTNQKGFSLYNPGPFLPLGRTATITMYFLLSLTIMSIILLAANALISKKMTGSTRLQSLNILMDPRSVVKSILVGLALLGAAYGSLMVIEYFFGQDYRAWMTAFSDMKAEFWFIGLKYAMFIFPMYIIMGAAVNYTVRTDIPEWLDTLIVVLVNSLGLWICALINTVVAYTSYDGTLFSSFVCSYQFLLCVPITVYLSRKLFRLTHSVWTGATLNTCIIVWSMMCSLGINDVYIGQTMLGNFLNI